MCRDSRLSDFLLAHISQMFKDGFINDGSRYCKKMCSQLLCQDIKLGPVECAYLQVRLQKIVRLQKLEFIAQQPCRYRGLQHVRGTTDAYCKGGTGFAFVKSGSAHTEKSTVCYVTESCCTDLCPDQLQESKQKHKSCKVNMYSYFLR